jgi:hypothetical protein
MEDFGVAVELIQPSEELVVSHPPDGGCKVAVIL